MQEVIGFGVLAVVLCGAYLLASSDFQVPGDGILKKTTNLIGRCLLYFAVCYTALFLVGGVLLILAEIGILLREITLWILAAAILPFQWLF